MVRARSSAAPPPAPPTTDTPDTSPLPDHLARLQLQQGDVLHAVTTGPLRQADADRLHVLLAAAGLDKVLVLLTGPDIRLERLDDAAMQRRGWQRIPMTD